MKKHLQVIIYIAISFACTSTYSQVDILNDEWRDHLSYSHAYQLAEAGDWIYAAAQTGLLSFNQKTSELRKHSKVTGLSDVHVSTIKYSKETGYLIVGYQNGNIDLLKDGEAPINLSDIKRRIMTAQKIIYNIYTYGNEAYLACGFGIVVINLEKAEVKETYLLGDNGGFIKVNDITIFNNTIYAATEDGIYSASLNSPNLLDFNYWSRLSFIPQSTSEYKVIELYNEKMFLVYEDQVSLEDRIITVTGDNYQAWNKSYDTLIVDITSENGYLGVCSYRDATFYNASEKQYAQYDIANNEQAIISAYGTTFFASAFSGLLRWNNGTLNYLLVDGPRHNSASKVFTRNDQVWITTGSSDNFFTRGECYSFINNKWNSYYKDDIWLHETDNTNSYKVAVDPLDDNHVYIASYSSGITEIDNGSVTHIVYKDLPVFDDIPVSYGLRISGLEFDSQNNLWFIISIASNPLCCIDPAGNLTRYEISHSLLNTDNTKYTDLLVTSNDQIWISTINDGIIILEDQGDGEFLQESFEIKNQSGIQLNMAYCLEEDNDGNIWVGTNLGPIIYYSPLELMGKEDISGFQPTISRNDGTDNIDFLLFSEVIYDIECDGGNQKWLATENSGVYLISEEGKETLLNFHETNSPMISNTVTGVGVQEKTGEVFFATSNGVLSYGGAATVGANTYDNAYVYPNPVRPNYDGIITVTGLVENSIVKITDISGNLVWETNSLGGHALWDGRNFNGDRVASGVYLFMLATEDGSQSHIVKLLFMH